MKKIILFIALFVLPILSWAQSNSGRGYLWQGVIRNANNQILQNEKVELQVKLYNEAADYWTESHTAQTDEQGVVLIRIGKGIKVSGSCAAFTDVDFQIVNKQLISLKEKGDLRTLIDEEIPSVPFAETAIKGDIPIGTIIIWHGSLSSVPAGWVECNGAEKSLDASSEYYKLYQAIGKAWGGTTSTFRIPDFRGLFLRGVDGTADKDPDKNSRTALYSGGNSGNKVGSFQADQFRKHTHTYSIKHRGTTWGDDDGGTDEWRINAVGKSNSTGNTTGSYGGKQTNPSNYYVYYIIKYK